MSVRSSITIERDGSTGNKKLSKCDAQMLDIIKSVTSEEITTVVENVRRYI